RLRRRGGEGLIHHAGAGRRWSDDRVDAACQYDRLVRTLAATHRCRGAPTRAAAGDAELAGARGALATRQLAPRREPSLATSNQLPPSAACLPEKQRFGG